MTRTKGSKNKDGYNLTPSAYAQRQMAALKDGHSSKVWKQIIDNEDKTGIFKEEFEKYKLSVWRELGSPLMFMANEIANFKAFVMTKMMSGSLEDKDIIAYNKLLLDLTKEYNKYSQVTADTKANVAKTILNNSEDFDWGNVKVIKTMEDLNDND